MTEMSLLENVSNPFEFRNEVRAISLFLADDISPALMEQLSLKFYEMDTLGKETFLKSLASFKILSESREIDIRIPSGKKTVKDLEYLFERWNLRTADDFFDKITDEDCVELYRGSQQMYSNNKFHQLCSYDILFVLLYGFDQLFERDMFTTNRIVSRVQEICMGPMQTSRWNVPTHILKEKDTSASLGKSFYIEPGYIAPVIALESDIEEPLWLSTLRATPILD